MTASTTLQTTPLNQAHRAAGAKMVDFGGWDMPVNYGSQIGEHDAVRQDAANLHHADAGPGDPGLRLTPPTQVGAFPRLISRPNL